MAVLLVIGLAVADIVTYTSLRSFLVGRLDSQIGSSQGLAFRYLVRAADRGVAPTHEALDERISPDVYVLILDRQGKVTLSLPSGSTDRPDPTPVVPRSLRAQVLPFSASSGRKGRAYQPSPDGFEMNGPPGSGVRYRAQAITVPQGTLITAISLDPTDATLSSLLRIELLVSLAVVAALCILALWTVRRGLRPLDQMTRTAGAIASGDLTRRVEAEDESTEVGRLGTALNSMLTQIETAFAEKSASEERLRQFVADASHELRTPLTSIRGYAELLRKGVFADEESRDRALGRIEHEAGRMGGLVDDLSCWPGWTRAGPSSAGRWTCSGSVATPSTTRGRPSPTGRSSWWPPAPWWSWGTPTAWPRSPTTWCATPSPTPRRAARCR